MANTLETGVQQAVVIGHSRDNKVGSDGKIAISYHEKPIVGTLKQPSGNQQDFIGHKSRIRRLTPVECERLQGFPDNWTEQGLAGGGPYKISDTQRYKMMGNAVTVNVVEAIAKKLFLSL